MTAQGGGRPWHGRHQDIATRQPPAAGACTPVPHGRHAVGAGPHRPAPL